MARLHMSPPDAESWWSEAEYRDSIGKLSGLQDASHDDVFQKITDHLVTLGILRRERRFGVPGYTFRHVAVVVTPADGGH